MLDRLYLLNPWIAYGLSVVIVLLAAEIGHLIGRSWRRGHPGDRWQGLATLEGAALGLLALMIGFTFSMAMIRYDHRLSGVLQEANAIGTTALRADMLPEPYAGKVKKLLRDYVQVRLDLFRAPPTATALQRSVRRSRALQKEIWREAVTAAAAEPHSIPVGLFVRSLNEMIDLQEVRLAAGRNRIPDAVFFLLYGIAAVSIGFGGYVGGLAGGKGRIPVAIIAALVAGVIGLISDFDRAHTGFITVSQQATQSLKESIDR